MPLLQPPSLLSVSFYNISVHLISNQPAGFHVVLCGCTRFAGIALCWAAAPCSFLLSLLLPVACVAGLFRLSARHVARLQQQHSKALQGALQRATGALSSRGQLRSLNGEALEAKAFGDAVRRSLLVVLPVLRLLMGFPPRLFLLLQAVLVLAVLLVVLLLKFLLLHLLLLLLYSSVAGATRFTLAVPTHHL